MQNTLPSVSINDPDYPSLLRAIPFETQPQRLYYLGNAPLLNTEWIGFTGMQHATPDAVDSVYAWAHILAQQGYTLVCEGRRGIETAVLQAANVDSLNYIRISII